MYNFQIELPIIDFLEWTSNLSKNIKKIIKNILNFMSIGGLNNG
jgi:hypothetical protein